MSETSTTAAKTAPKPGTKTSKAAAPKAPKAPAATPPKADDTRKQGMDLAAKYWTASDADKATLATVLKARKVDLSKKAKTPLAADVEDRGRIYAQGAGYRSP